MVEGDFDLDCENCECLTCSENECKNPEETIDDLVEAMEIVDKTKMLKELLDDLKNKTDKEIIQDYRDRGIDVISYAPNTKGKIILRD